MEKQISLLEEYKLIFEPVKWKFENDEEKTFLVLGGEVKKISSGEIKNLGLMAEILVSETEADQKKYNLGEIELYEFYLEDNNLKMKKIEPTDGHYKKLSSAFEYPI